MSIVTAFVTAAHSQAAAMLGQEPVTIGNDSILCVLNEATDGSDFSEGGYEVTKTLSAVCLTSALPTAAILKKSATARGLTFRVDSVSKGGTFTTISLSQISKA